MFGFKHWLNPLFNAYVHLLSLLPYKWLYKSVTDDIPERNSPYFTIFHWETHHFPPIKNHPVIPPVPLRRGQLFTGLFLFLGPGRVIRPVRNLRFETTESWHVHGKWGWSGNWAKKCHQIDVYIRLYTCMNVVRICTDVICRFYVDCRLVISCVSSLRNIHFLFADHRPTGHNMPSPEWRF